MLVESSVTLNTTLNTTILDDGRQKTSVMHLESNITQSFLGQAVSCVIVYARGYRKHNAAAPK